MNGSDRPEALELVAYCHSGSRSALAAEILRSLGYNASNYRGSWHEWSRDESLPAELGVRLDGREKRRAEPAAEVVPAVDPLPRRLAERAAGRRRRPGPR